MTEAILSLPPVLGALLAVGVTILLALVPYAALRAMFLRAGETLTNDLANSIVVRVSALHALILALVFAQELVNLRDINTAANREAVLVNDVFFDLARYAAPEQTTPIREQVALYAHLVLAEEWDGMAETGSLLPAAWDSWQAAYGGILELAPENPRQEALKDIMLADIREISGLRRTRENAGLAGVPGMFLAAAVLGVVLTAAAFYPHRPTRQTLTLIAIFASYTGLIVYFVIAFAHPYNAPGRANPLGFEQVYGGQLGEWGRRAAGVGD
ncbi:MAG: hypothetical protein RIG84_15510 [Roseovarius sp.]